MNFFKKLFGQKESAQTKNASKSGHNHNTADNAGGLGNSKNQSCDSCTGRECETCVSFWETLGITEFQGNNPSQAEVMFRKALELDSESGSTWYNLGLCRGKLGDDEDAYKCFKRAYDVGRITPDVLGNLLIACQRTNRPDEGLKYCGEYAKFDKERSEHMFNTFLEMKGKANSESPFADAERHLKVPAEAMWANLDMRDDIHKIAMFIRQIAKNSVYYNQPVIGLPSLPAVYDVLPKIIYTQLARFLILGVEEPEWMVAGGFYAGHTGVAVWAFDKSKVQQDGMAELLTSPGLINRTIMFTHDLHNESSQRHKMAVELEELSRFALKEARGRLSHMPDSNRELMSIIAAMYVMAIFGMQINMYEKKLC